MAVEEEEEDSLPHIRGGSIYPHFWGVEAQNGQSWWGAAATRNTLKEMNTN